MRKISKKERTKAGNIYCSYCRPLKVHAVYRVHGFTSHSHGYACEEHKNRLDCIDEHENDQSEGEHQAMKMFGI